jgi:multimeric flavodoxin WrbA
MRMKVIAVSGSPRQGGNSDVAARTILAALSCIGETELVRVADYTVRHCTGCGRCNKLQQCVIQDDQFRELVAKWKEADLLVISDPVYWLNPPGIMKDFIDRTVSLVNQPSPSFENIKVVLVTIAAENGFELHNELLSRWLRAQGAKVIGSIDVYAWDKDDLAHDRPQTLRLERLASEICGKMNSQSAVA